MVRQGILFIISAPSGAGKTTLVNALMETVPNIKVSVSHTTRPKRIGEEHGSHYYFVSDREFQQMIEKNAFLEHAQVFGYYYGTSREWVENALKEGSDVILEIDWQGAQQVRKKLPEAVSIFILPPSYQILRERLTKRAKDNPEVIGTRLQQAKNEIAHHNEFDYLVVNDDFQSSLSDLQSIFRAQHLRKKYQTKELANLLTNLLA